jgi:hypothetical protein
LSDTPSTAAPGAQPAQPQPEPVAPAQERTQGETLAKSAGLVSIAVMASRLLGLVRDQVLLIAFGMGDRMDAFNVAFRLPNLVRDLFAEGAMSAAFVPTRSSASSAPTRSPAGSPAATPRRPARSN